MSQLEIFEDKFGLEINMKWFKPVAFFLLFFCIAWDSFLIFWYSMAFTGGAPWIMILFPIIHVAVGIGLTYYTLCLFLNKTKITVQNDYLTVSHKPIPWWKGNKEFAVRDIKQIYVKQKQSSSNNSGVKYSYELRAKLHDNKDVALMSINESDSQKMQEIEAKLEAHIGITDEAVIGEYQKSRNWSTVNHSNAPTQARVPNNNPISKAYNKAITNDIYVKNKWFDVASITQSEWNDGNVDKQFQLLDENLKESLVYFERNKAILKAYQEEKLTLQVTKTLNFKEDDLPDNIIFNLTSLHLSQHKIGNNTISGSNQKIKTDQWIYLSADGKKQLRICSNNGLLNYYFGEKLENKDFEDTLDLDNPNPFIEPIRRDTDYDREDFV